MDPNVFHPGRGESEIAAKALCAACPVQIHCLRYALNASEHIGIWGSTSERQRRVLRSASRVSSNREGITYAEAIDIEIRLWSKRETAKREDKQRERQESILEAQRLATEQPERAFKHVLTPSGDEKCLDTQNDKQTAHKRTEGKTDQMKTAQLKRSPKRRWLVRVAHQAIGRPPTRQTTGDKAVL